MNFKSNSLALGARVSAIDAWTRKAGPKAQRQLNNAMKDTAPRGFEEKTDAYFKAIVNAQNQ